MTFKEHVLIIFGPDTLLQVAPQPFQGTCDADESQEHAEAVSGAGFRPHAQLEAKHVWKIMTFIDFQASFGGALITRDPFRP